MVGTLFAWVVRPSPAGILLAGLAILILFGFTMRRLFGRAWGPLSDLIDATTRLGEGDTSVRIDTARPGPWTGVVRSFNRMAQRLADEDERRRRLLADLGHELRTPLAVIQGEIEAVIDGVHPPQDLRNVLDEVTLMERLLEDLGTLALAEAGRLELRLEPTDLGDLVEDVIDSFSSMSDAQGVVVTSDTRGGSIVDVDPQRIHQVVGNLLRNALGQMPEGGRLQITVRGAEIVVDDSGPGIDDEALGLVFDRFVKSADSKGSGLGLSIAKDIVEAHGGTITASRAPGGGARLVIDLVSRPAR
jgi:signal transduction histidine kinase